MVLLDTSIWIEFLNKSDKYFQEVSELLLGNKIICTDFIFGELLQGVRSTSESKIIIELYNNLPKSIIVDIFTHAGFLSYKNQFIQKGIGLIDSAIIFSCYQGQHQLWTLDKKIKTAIQKNFLYKI